jgi:hypothetical protein
MTIRAALCAVVLVMPGAASAEDVGATHLMATAKFAGICGLFGQMTAFQEATQMSGGNEFIARFFNTEAARLGYTAQEYADHCKKAVTIYSDIFKMAEEEAAAAKK